MEIVENSIKTAFLPIIRIGNLNNEDIQLKSGIKNHFSGIKVRCVVVIVVHIAIVSSAFNSLLPLFRLESKMTSRKHKQFLDTLVVAVDALRKLTNVAHRWAYSGVTVPLCRLIACGLSVNTTHEDGRTLLHTAAAGGHTQTVLELIRLGAEKAIVICRLGTPLHQAAGLGHVSAVKAMLKAGCPVDVVASSRFSVLHASAGGGNTEVIREVLSTGCDINATDNDGRTPLHVSARKGNTEAALELIRCGARKAIVAGAWGTPLHQAAGFGHVSTVKAMLKAGCPVDVVTSNGATVLHAAAHGGSAQMIREVLSTGCDINAVDSDGVTPLHVAAGEGKTEAALELIRHGAEKAIVAGAWGTPLHTAAWCGHVSTVEAMLKAGCPVDVVDHSGRSVLHAATGYGYVEVMDELLSSGCNVHATDNAGNTPLDFAACRGEVKAALKLVRHGADKHTAGGTFGGPVLSAAALGHWMTVQVMMEEGFPVDGVATNGQTLLHFTAMDGKDSLLRQLAERGFNVSRRDFCGLTPLHYAVYNHRVECAKALLELGASVRTEAPLFGTVLDIVRLGGYPAMERLLCGSSLQMRRRDEMIVDFALCKELGINIQSPYLFSEQGGRISVFEYFLFYSKQGKNAVQMARNQVRTPKNLRKVLSVFSRHQLVNLSKLACLAAIYGDVVVLECLSELLTTPTEPGQFFNRLKQLYPIQFRQPESILLQVLPECDLNPLQLAIIAMWCGTAGLSHFCIGRSSRRYAEVIRILATNDSFHHTLNDCLPNGLSPLDLAEKLGLDEVIDIISSAGGRHGILSLIPEEIRLQHESAVLHLHQGLMQLTSSGVLGQQAVQTVISQLPGRSTVEQGTAMKESHIHQQKVLDQRPDLSIISTYFIGCVNVEQWRRFGISLKIPPEALSHISSTHSSCEERYLEVLIYWLAHNEAASWRTLLEVLGHFETKHTMDRLTQEVLAGQDSAVS